MRLLIVTFGTASRESGAPQLALHLADALRNRGHEVVSWASGEPPPSLRFWQRHPWRLRRLEAFLATAPPFDAIDAPPIAVSRSVARTAPTVARSVQPDWLYFLAELPAAGRELRRRPLRTAAHLLYGLALQRAVSRGCRRATRLLLLGSQELAWVRRRRPRFAARSTAYFAAVPPEEHEVLARLRRREPRAGALRYLWLGRWAAHKGVDTLCRFLAARLATHPGERFTLAGCGTEAEGALPELVRESGRVEVVPTFSRAELPVLLARHDAGLFTSEVEGWGLSLNEMLEAGLPVFATRAGAVPDLEPFVPQQLLPFPPPAEVSLPRPDDLEARGYFRHFTWEAIAERYEREVLAALPGLR